MIYHKTHDWWPTGPITASFQDNQVRVGWLVKSKGLVASGRLSYCWQRYQEHCRVSGKVEPAVFLLAKPRPAKVPASHIPTKICKPCHHVVCPCSSWAGTK